LTGTTDTTRTLLFDDSHKDNKEVEAYYTYLKEMYTRVLMGNLDLQETKVDGGPVQVTYGH
jgi:hypothetical protein